MAHQMECCFINRLNGSEAIFSKLEKRPNVKVETFNCIGNCHQCSEEFHCVLNGERLRASTPEQLYEIIIEKLK
ncbi:DUF1450 domain-containing protein [Alkalihalobacterium chitinilyticum]|uniref:YuzB family protein n=1 Tax=Alkalihalobacterium chitinilyticum TaxID=2980103 RepID=A0ABT5VIQ3_9BACI|nr:DUF1450 domain-containing protein [Alkalihalobacterium chitinilyticum]MDE5415331.1 YuzB family protein [Alkalihalobacterium chitinilyticum]